MIDKELYCETFSKLQASPSAKKEVLTMMKNKKNNLWKTVVLAAVMALALAATAGAVNMATDGALVGRLRQLWTEGNVTRYQIENNGRTIDVTVAGVDESQGDVSYHVEEDVTLSEDGKSVITITEGD